jgi:antitoxin (DNA-binding transcriptional repressor) of toxin-antitoxin stability system
VMTYFGVHAGLDLRNYVNYINMYMRTIISSTEVARNLGDFLARVKHKGDRFVIMKNNRPVAELGPVSGVRETTLGALWAAMREVKVDEDFAGDLERVNTADSVMENPWV